ncbi:ribonuclease P protein subunit p25-like protein [Sitophilus oryzae]|uniref:Ribonuclease P protein subunit p25-like protein n=1 Tax=Sitophilus oryzae TaxID=7048 RepID=A0A6J2YE42_SITOR|nr:ribonuclease P protein subunit p25-like protein [Sitophilus oryzae]
MENYRKGRNHEEPLTQETLQIKNLPEKILWMQVRGGSKIRNLLEYALKTFPENKVVVWTGFGTSVGKAITCAEIMKREYNNVLHQVTKLAYRNVEEYWDPLIPDMDQLVVKRKLPMVHVCLSEQPLDINDSGYQAPGDIVPYTGPGSSQPHSDNRNYGKHREKKKKHNGANKQNNASSSSSNSAVNSNK